jgi:hypothetical protein
MNMVARTSSCPRSTAWSLVRTRARASSKQPVLSSGSAVPLPGAAGISGRESGRAGGHGRAESARDSRPDDLAANSPQAAAADFARQQGLTRRRAGADYVRRQSCLLRSGRCEHRAGTDASAELLRSAPWQRVQLHRLLGTCSSSRSIRRRFSGRCAASRR